VSLILWVNPVANNTYDGAMAAALARIVRPGTRVDVVSLARGPATLEYGCYEAVMAADLLGTVRWAEGTGYDALVIGCFHDPFLKAAREITARMQVTGPAEAALRTASSLGQGLAVLLPRRHLAATMWEMLREHGMAGRAALRFLDMEVEELQADPAATEERLAREARAAVEEGGADVVVLGCSVAFGFHERLQERIGVPVLDPAVVAVKHAEYLAELAGTCGWRHSKRYGYESPPADAVDRLLPPLAPPAVARMPAPAADD
jgi:allantoin racemase